MNKCIECEEPFDEDKREEEDHWETCGKWIEEDLQAENNAKFRAFQRFETMLSLEETKQVKRYLIAIEKALFTK